MKRGLLLAFFCSTALAQQYEVYAIRYAVIPQFPVAELVAGEKSDRKLDIAMMVWLVRGGGKNILFDAGFYRPQFFKSWTVQDFARPDEAVAQAGVKPEEITEIPRSAIRSPRSAARNRETRSAGRGRPFNLSGRMHLIDGDQEILPGVRVYTGGRHTFDAASNLKAQDRMKEIAGDPKRIVPGHDPAVMTRYPRVAPRVGRID
jgi:glyoxylase-like metal-dependent hydrolase (beta-lactamase superfamily II)